MSPVRDPDDRSLRRMEKDSARSEARSSAAPDRDRGRESPPRPRPQAASLEEEFERLPKRERHGGRRSEAAARRLGRLRAEDRAEVAAGSADLLPGVATVVAVTRGQCDVELEDGGSAVAYLPKALADLQRSEVAVGDLVRLERRPAGALAVGRLLPRRSRLSRPDPFHAHRERVVAANLDLAVIVAALRKPPLSTGLLDRYLVALAHGGVPAAIVANKAYLVEPPREADPEVAQLVPYRRLGVPLILASARSGEGIEELRALLAGRTVAFVGHSGVGKSALLNALDPEAGAQVGEVSEAHRKGRHTTTRSRVYRLAGGTRVIDTPGIREFGLWQLSARELAAYFDEFEPFAAACRFGDCSHVHEPACAVRAAAERGELLRYDTYLRILDSLGRR
jgi:ribosome biogenesis GTPase